MRLLVLLNAALVSLLGALVVYVVGLVEGRFFDLRAWRVICGGKALDAGDPYGASRWFPPSQQCRWRDGTTTDLVPSYVDPLMFGLLALGVLLLLAALVSWRRAA